MNMTEIRYRNARMLVDSCDGMASFSEKIGKAATQASAFAGINPRKGIGNKIARELEVIFGKPYGWMDTPHSQESDRGIDKLMLAIEDFTQEEIDLLVEQARLVRRARRDYVNVMVHSNNGE